MTVSIPILNEDIFETTLTKMCGAIYGGIDAIIFGVFKSINTGDVYMRVSIERNEDTYDVYERIYELDKVPENVMELYTYIDFHSYFVFDEYKDKFSLIGDHIGRRATRDCVIMSLYNNPTKMNTIELINITKNKNNEYDNVFSDIYDTYSSVKKYNM